MEFAAYVSKEELLFPNIFTYHKLFFLLLCLFKFQHLPSQLLYGLSFVNGFTQWKIFIGE